MFSIINAVNYDDDEWLNKGQNITHNYTLSPFISSEHSKDIKNQAKESVLKDYGREEVIKLLKQL